MMAYNGWSNYATWATSLWLNNEYSYYRWLAQKKEEVVDCSNSKQQQVRVLAIIIEDFFYDIVPQLPASIASDLLGWAIEQINFVESAENMLEE